MRTLKVLAGLTSVNNIPQVRTILAVETKKQAIKILGISMYELNTYWSVTGNALEITIAESKPYTIFKSKGVINNDFEEQQ